MSEERKLHAGVWIVTVLIGLPVLYVASFGPVCWIMSRTYGQQLPDAHRPIGWLVRNSPRFVVESSPQLTQLIQLQSIA